MQFHEPVSPIFNNNINRLTQSELDAVLRDAASDGDEDAFEEALIQGAAIDTADLDGVTALHHAALNGHEAIAARLLALEAPANARDEDGWTPLHHAAAAGHENIVRQLIRHGADLTARSATGRTAAHWAYKGEQNQSAAIINEAISQQHAARVKAMHKRSRMGGKSPP